MLAVVAAFREEVYAFLKAGRFRQVSRSGRLRFCLSRSMPNVVVAEGGFGRRGARECVSRTVSMFAPNMIVCAGFGAGAADGQASGGVVVCERLVTADGPPYAWQTGSARTIETGWRALDGVRDALGAEYAAGYTVGSCMTAPMFVSSPAMKRWIGSAYGVSMIDMESYWVAEAASQHGVPCLPVRVVLDPVEQSVSRLVGDSLDDTRLRRAVRSAGYLATHPADAPGMVKLSLQVRRAGISLGDFLSELLHKGFAVR